MNSLKLKEIALLVNGQVFGDPDVYIAEAATLGNAGPDSITFATNQKTWEQFVCSKAAAAIVSGTVPSGERPYIVVADAESAFAQIVAIFRPPLERKPVGVSPQACVDPTASVAEGVDIYPGAIIGAHVTIGAGTTIMPGVVVMEHCSIGCQVTLFPNVVLYENTQIGDRSMIHAGAVIGAFGFGYKSRNGKHSLVPQLGRVVIGCDVEIGANATIDRGTYDDTRIGDGTKIDNLVMIGHNCRIGAANLLCSQVGIAGSCTTGDHVVMAGQVGIGDHLQIGDRVTLGAKSGVMHSIPDDQIYLGIPAIPVREQMQVHAATHRLPEMRKQVKELQRTIDELKHSVAELQSHAPPCSHTTTSDPSMDQSSATTRAA
ncbi:MAG TPA: UDP-3-O-(3-hydroxymyristoyl)glucosamine N-acyltransferase [Pirellulaceae bacterium]|nr:UDP-3-O-(3-hydroxymyristoyl)glucosamine N-acyltransferase [Pirellulaceae bacterium]